jgi:hypothetical protein
MIEQKCSPGMGWRRAQTWGGDSVDLVEVDGRRPWKRDWGRAERRPWRRALQGQRQVGFEAATSSNGLVACRCSAGQTVRGRAVTAGACAKGSGGLRTSTRLHPRQCRIEWQTKLIADLQQKQSNLNNTIPFVCAFHSSRQTSTNPIQTEVLSLLYANRTQQTKSILQGSAAKAQVRMYPILWTTQCVQQQVWINNLIWK